MPRQILRILDVYCRSCSFLLLNYRKGGKGHLIKCHLHKIVKDYTSGGGFCPNCGAQWGRAAIIKNRPALKIIGERVFWKWRINMQFNRTCLGCVGNVTFYRYNYKWTVDGIDNIRAYVLITERCYWHFIENNLNLISIQKKLESWMGIKCNNKCNWIIEWVYQPYQLLIPNQQFYKIILWHLLQHCIPPLLVYCTRVLLEKVAIIVLEECKGF